MNNEFLATLEYIAQERGLSKEQLISTVESAILTASRKSIHQANDLTVKIDRKTGAIKAWAKLKVVEAHPDDNEIALSAAKTKIPDAQIGDIVDWEVTPSNFGRIAASAARQTILQQLNKEEKEIVKNEFGNKTGEILNGTVRRIDSGDVIIEFQKTEGKIPSRERIPGEQYQVGERINALLMKVDIEGSGPSLILSRASNQFVRKLFEREVTEIHDGIVEIKGVAREPGIRSKIAVACSDKRIDPVGSCVGTRGMRVRNITRELGGERIDVIEYSNDIQTYLRNALQPAKIISIDVDQEKKRLTVYVDEENSKLAFGKKMQNFRLAQRLIQWGIDIIVVNSENPDFEKKKADALKGLASSLNLSENQAQILLDNGFLTIAGLRSARKEDLANIPGITEDILNAIDAAIARTQQN